MIKPSQATFTKKKTMNYNRLSSKAASRIAAKRNRQRVVVISQRSCRKEGKSYRQ